MSLRSSKTGMSDKEAREWRDKTYGKAHTAEYDQRVKEYKQGYKDIHDKLARKEPTHKD